MSITVTAEFPYNMTISQATRARMNYLPPMLFTIESGELSTVFRTTQGSSCWTHMAIYCEQIDYFEVPLSYDINLGQTDSGHCCILLKNKQIHFVLARFSPVDGGETHIIVPARACANAFRAAAELTRSWQPAAIRRRRTEPELIVDTFNNMSLNSTQ